MVRLSSSNKDRDLNSSSMRNLKDKDVSLNYDVLKKIRIGLAFAGLLLFAFVAWQILEVHRGPTVFDDAIRFKVYEMRDDRLTPFVRAVTYFGNWQTTIIIAGLLVLCKKTRLKIGVPAAAMAVISVTMYTGLKLIFNRPRPDRALWLVIQHDSSFPSGHSLNCLVFYGTIFYLIFTGVYTTKHRTPILVLLALLIFSIGASRVYLGVHYPTDIIGGWSLGIFLLMFFSFWVDRNSRY